MTPHEDDPPNTPPPSVPETALEHFEEPPIEAPTEPPPPLDVDAIIGVVTGTLSAKLELCFDGVHRRLDTLSAAVAELRTWAQNTDPKLDAFDRGIGSALNVVTNAAAQVERLADAFQGLDATVRELTVELATHRAHTIDAYDRLGARVVPLEDYVRARTGEDDGSLTAAARRRGDPPAE